MAKTDWIVLAVRWSVKYFFASDSPISRKSLDEGSKQTARQLQSVTLYKQMR